MNLLPDSLFGRLLSALLLVIGLTVTIIVVLIVRERQDLAYRGSTAADLVALIAEASTTIAELPPEARDAELARIRGEAFNFDRPARSPQAPPQDAASAARILRARLERELGQEYGVDIRPARPIDDGAIVIGFSDRRLAMLGRRGSGQQGPEWLVDDEWRALRDAPAPEALRLMGRGPRILLSLLDVAVTLPDGERLVFRTPVPPAEPPLPRQIFLELGLLSVLLAAVLFGMARTITRPLSDLASAADAVGRGERVAPLRETGARELREATRAFNAMQERLHRYLASRTRVLAAISHDLHTPLTRLKLRAEMLDDPALRERFTADVDEMNAMVSGALKLFRGLNDHEPAQPVDISALLEELRAEFVETGGDVTISGSAAAPLLARRPQLKRCLANLLANALAYGKRATVVVEEDEADLVIRVLDEGPGIPEGALEQVFEPFFRLEGSRNATTGGTGLGLSIARDMAQAHAGSLVLRNRVPRGLEAVLRLPRGALTR